MTRTSTAGRRSTDRRFTPVALTAMLILLSVLVAAAWELTGTSAEGPIVEILAPTQGRVGEAVELTLIVRNVSNVGGYQARALFDASTARFGGINHSSGDVAATGRFVQTIGPGEIAGGASFGMYSCATRSCDATTSKPVTSGASGDVTLGTISILPDAAGSLTIVISGLRIADTSGVDIPIAHDSLTITISVTDEGE
jgi:hypothetical protein